MPEYFEEIFNGCWIQVIFIIIQSVPGRREWVRDDMEDWYSCVKKENGEKNRNKIVKQMLAKSVADSHLLVPLRVWQLC